MDFFKHRQQHSQLLIKRISVGLYPKTIKYRITIYKLIMLPTKTQKYTMKNKRDIDLNKSDCYELENALYFWYYLIYYILKHKYNFLI